MQHSLFDNILPQVQKGSHKAIARCISLIENQVDGFEEFMQQLPASPVPVIGITGPPGAGKSTIVDGLVGHLINLGKKVGVLCVDPSSPFNLGALLGDRIRMSHWYNHPNVFIRSLASRGSVGGLHPAIIEITDVMKVAGFDYVIVETVGVGQSEIEIAGLADITIVTLVPEGGDEIQAMKAGLMEIAEIFVVNKADRPNADDFVRNLRLMLVAGMNNPKEIPIIKTVALQQQGIAELGESILLCLQKLSSTEKRYWLLAERAYYLVQKHKMAGVSKLKMRVEIMQLTGEGRFNMYQFVHQFY